jgi:outer membrane protein
MRTALILLLLTAALHLSAQDYKTNVGVKETDQGIRRIEAPMFGSGDYFKTHFDPVWPLVDVDAPSRLADFVIDDHLELSLRGYLELVLANNTQIGIQKLSVEAPRNAITRSLARFDPTLSASFRSNRAESPTASSLEGAQTLNQLSQPFSVNYGQLLTTGTNYQIGFSGQKRSTNSEFTTVNPSVNGSVDFSLTQPLLRDFGKRANKLQFFVAQSRFKQNRFNLSTQLLRLVSIAENTYWAVIEARENLRVSRENLRLNEVFLKRSERELELGAISPLDIYQPQQNKANAEIFVTQAYYRLEQAEDALRRQISADLDPTYSNMPITLTEEVLPPANEETVDSEQMVELAYRMRPDLLSDLQSLEIDDLNHEIARNSLRPDLSLSLNYSSSGLGGNVFEFAPGADRVVLRTIPGGFGDMFSQVFDFNFPTYGFTLNLRLPLRDRRAVADLADAAVSKKQDTLRVQDTQQAIRLDVLTAVSQFESSKARVKQAQVSLDFSQKRLDAEQMKYDLGVTTIFFVLDAQNALVSAQSELVTAAAQYQRNLTNLYRVTGQLLDERGVVVQD